MSKRTKNKEGPIDYTKILKPISELPRTERQLQQSKYSRLLDAIMSMDGNIFEVDYKQMDVALKTVYVTLSKHITRKQLPLKLALRKDRLFIVKT